MIAVIFELEPKPTLEKQYFDMAAKLRPLLEGIDGFISIERFKSVSEPGKYLSLSFWRDEQAVADWRNAGEHRSAQQEGRVSIFNTYRLRVAEVTRDYGMSDRDEAPTDSLAVHDN